jgi:membrane protease YdiL (CAAX protease family)
MSSGRLVGLALASEAALAAIAIIVARAVGLPIAWGEPVRDSLIGVVAAGGLAVVNHTLLRRAPSTWIVNGVRAVYHEVLVPVFGALPPYAIGVIGVAAGLGEELLFRGVLQPLFGWVAASLAFGLAHSGSRDMLPFAAWASIMGAALGGLAMATGGLTAPVVAHGLYDVLALAYIRTERQGRARECQ